MPSNAFSYGAEIKRRNIYPVTKANPSREIPQSFDSISVLLCELFIMHIDALNTVLSTIRQHGWVAVKLIASPQLCPPFSSPTGTFNTRKYRKKHMESASSCVSVNFRLAILENCEDKEQSTHVTGTESQHTSLASLYCSIWA